MIMVYCAALPGNIFFYHLYHHVYHLRHGLAVDFANVGLPVLRLRLDTTGLSPTEQKVQVVQTCHMCAKGAQRAPSPGDSAVSMETAPPIGQHQHCGCAFPAVFDWSLSPGGPEHALLLLCSGAEEPEDPGDGPAPGLGPDRHGRTHGEAKRRGCAHRRMLQVC